MSAFPSPTKTYHTTSYDAISPSLPALSQKGKNVIITGGGAGIGKATALSFAKASVTNLALVGRRLQPLEDLKSTITSSYPEVSVHVYSADIADEAALKDAFASFAKQINGPIHTLVANAGMSPGFLPVMEVTTEDLMASLNANTIGTLNTVKAFIPHIPTEADETGFRAKIIHTSTGAAQVEMPLNTVYSLGKAAGAKLLQHVALEHPDIFVLNYHPGIIETEMIERERNKSGYDLNPKDDSKLCYHPARGRS